MFGLGADVPAVNDLVRETLAERHEFRPYLPPHLIPLHNDGAGNLAALDTRRSGDDPPVTAARNARRRELRRGIRERDSLVDRLIVVHDRDYNAHPPPATPAESDRSPRLKRYREE